MCDLTVTYIKKSFDFLQENINDYARNADGCIGGSEGWKRLRQLNFR